MTLRVHRGILSAAGSGLKNRVSRLSPAAWYQPGVGLTGALTVSNWADQALGDGTRDLAQGTAGNQPINLPHTGTDYAYLPGVAGNNFSTPDSAAFDPTSNTVCFVARIAANDYTPAAGQSGVVVGKAVGGGANSYGLRIYPTADGKFTAYVSYDGSSNIFTSSAAYSLTDATWYWVAAYVNATDGTCKYYTASDTGSNSTLPSSWTQLGSTITGLTTGTIKSSTSPMYVGADDVTNFFEGKMGRVLVYDGIAPTLGGSGTLMSDFDPSRFVETSTNATTATMSTGEVWTLNSTGAYPATIVKSSQILFGGVDEYMAATFTLNQPESIYIVFKQVSWTDFDYVFDGAIADSMLIYQRVAPPTLIAAAGAISGDNTNLAVGAFGIATVVFNGASSVFQINSTTALTGNYGSANGGGITLGCQAGPTTYGNIIVKEVLIFSAAHTAAQRAVVQNYLASRHQIAL